MSNKRSQKTYHFPQTHHIRARFEGDIEHIETDTNTTRCDGGNL